MSRLHRVATARDRSRGAVIFVHGLGGDAYGTWQSEGRPENFWPAWLGQDFPDLEVWTLSYDASPTVWFGYAMELPDRASNVLALLEAERLEDSPLIFVCHSLGGLIIKQSLRIAAERQNQRLGQILHKTHGVVFLATPNTGSDVASWADRIRTLMGASAAIQDLKADTAVLRHLNAWYRDNAPQEDIATLVFFETRGTRGLPIVDPTSADPGIPHVLPIAYDGDHITIAKPPSRDDLLYRRIVRFVEDRLPKPIAPPARSGCGSRVFISYRRRAWADARLANWLREQLSIAGHDVFIDVGITVGVEWSKEIYRRIDWCEFLIVLLSEDSVASEMVQQEVQLAAQRRRRDGTPRFLPVRVAYDGPLSYALGASLDRYQYVAWRTAADDRHVLETLLQAISNATPGLSAPLVYQNDSVPKPEAEKGPALMDIVGGPSSELYARPATAADPRVLRQPGGGMKLDDPCYLARSIDPLVRSLADIQGITLVLKGPRQTGKTSLLVRYLADCKRKNKRVALIDFQQFSDSELGDQKAAVTRIGRRLIKELAIDPSARQPLDTPGDLSDFFEDVIFPKIEQPIVLAFDEVDRFITSPYRDNLFGAMRGWHNNRATRGDRWESLDVALALATEPNLLIQDGEQSPFNVAEPFRLPPFSRVDLDRLNQVFGQHLAVADLDALHDLVGGHPYLTRMAFWHLLAGGVASFRDLERQAADEDGPFGEHLRAKLTQLLRRQSLVEAYRELVHRNVQPQPDTFWRLQAVGLADRLDRREIRPANLLYARFFSRTLQ
jgi:hypothetical protein